MRFRRGSEKARRWGQRSQDVQAAKRIAADYDRVDRPEAGRLLDTFRITDHVAGRSVEIKVFQAERKNQIVVRCFGRRSLPHGWDWLFRKLRERKVRHWLEI